MYIAFLDEFGHIGPYVSRDDPKYKHSPVFGLAGYVVPHIEARSFATWFYQIKCNLFSVELKHVRKHPATWEKKGTEFITAKNINDHDNIRNALFRVINRLDRCGARVIFYGREKYLAPEKSNPAGLYTTVMSHTIRNIDRYAGSKGHSYLMILDQHSSRTKLLESSVRTMFGSVPARGLIEPPFQVESHLYQTIQAADWIATILGRLWAYRTRPHEFPEWSWAEKFFGERLDAVTTHSSMWRPAGATPIPHRRSRLDAPPDTGTPQSAGQHHEPDNV